MREELQRKAKILACGLGMGAIMAVPVVSMLPSTAGAQTNSCYTGCTSPSSGITAADASGSPVTAASSTSTSGSLAFTGADLGEMALIGVGALGAGTLLVVRSRRRTA
jgi:hypothetical protein